MGEWERDDVEEAVMERRRPVVIETTQPAKLEEEEKAPLVMPGPPQQVAEEIAQIGVEGRPADVKAGPKMLWYELAFIVGLIVVMAVGVGLWLSWFAGFVVLGLGFLALLFNPVVGATLARARDREVVAHRHIHQS